MIDKNDPKQLAAALRLAADTIKAELGDNGDVWLRACKNWMIAEADRLDPPYKHDRSLWGWVLVTDVDTHLLTLIGYGLRLKAGCNLQSSENEPRMEAQDD